MKKIVIIRGPQGSGKTSFVRNLGLEGHYISYDKVREVVSGDSLGVNGFMTVPQEHNRLVVAMTWESLARRMKDGETIVFEATLPGAADVRQITKIAEEHNYKIIIVDFYHVDIDDVLNANAARPDRVRVPEYTVRRVYNEGRASVLPGNLNVVRVNDMRSTSAALEAVHEFLNQDCKIHDLSSYKKIIHIGDLQGTIHPLEDQRSPLANGIEPENFYIFCGDLFDRGVENDKVARWMLDNVVDKPNIAIIAGNHEDHVEAHASGRVPGSREYREKTMPQLDAAGISAEDLQKITEKLCPFVAYRWHDQKVLVTHGGLTRWPENFAIIPDTIYRRGNGQYGHGIDAMWVENEKESGFIQVHGHRNSKILPVLAAECGKSKSFNLEGQVEFGGHMRFAILDKNGWETIQIRSRKFRTMPEERAIATAWGRKEFEGNMPIVSWALEGRNKPETMSEKTMEALQNHDMVIVKQQTSMPHISSVSFSKSAFYSKNWDEYTTIARGLFIDNIDNTICARSYEKFFNHGERPETSDEGLEAHVQFPVQGFDKLNGFLCITGYSERTGGLIVASKSRVDGTFAEYAQQLVKNKLGDAGMEKMLRFNRDQLASLIFEAVDMENDPHIIDYPESKLVLIGCVRRGEKFEQVDYQTLKDIAKWLGVEVKEETFPKIKTWRALAEIMKRVETDPNWKKNNPTEGIVFQDASGFQWKSKAWYYARLKRCRSAVELILNTRKKDKPVKLDYERYKDMEEFIPFLDWAQTLSDEALKSGIISLYNMFKHDRAKAEAMGPAPVQKVKKNLDGYERGVVAMIEKCKNNTANKDSVIKIIESSKTDIDKMEKLKNIQDSNILFDYIA